MLKLCLPAISIIGLTWIPLDFISSISRKLMPLCFGASGLVLTNINILSALCADEVQTFVPFITKSSPSSTALVCNDAKSDPDSGSEYPWHH